MIKNVEVLGNNNGYMHQIEQQPMGIGLRAVNGYPKGVRTRMSG